MFFQKAPQQGSLIPLPQHIGLPKNQISAIYSWKRTTPHPVRMHPPNCIRFGSQDTGQLN